MSVLDGIMALIIISNTEDRKNYKYFYDALNIYYCTEKYMILSKKIALNAEIYIIKAIAQGGD